MPFRLVVCNIHAEHKTINCYSMHAVSISRVKISFIDLFYLIYSKYACLENFCNVFRALHPLLTHNTHYFVELLCCC